MANSNLLERQILISEQFWEPSDICHILNESQISRIVQSIPYNAHSQTVILQVRDRVRRDEDKLEGLQSIERTPETELAARKLAELSINYQRTFRKYLIDFKNWILCRQELIQEFITCANKLERNSMLLSGFRILTSTADLCGAMMQKAKSSWAGLVVEHAPQFSFTCLILENVLSTRMHKKIKSVVERDQKLFEPIKTWFQPNEDLDTAVQNFFPYGIDDRLLFKIHSYSSNADQCSIIFMAVIASNVRYNTSLIRERDFLLNAYRFSISEAGIHWYHTIIARSDPIYLECLNADLKKEINQITNSEMEKYELFYNAPFMLKIEIKTKKMLNILSIGLAAFNIIDLGKTDESEGLRKLAEKLQKELEDMDEILSLVNGNGSRS